MHKINIRPLDTIDGETLMSLPMEPPNFVMEYIGTLSRDRP